MILDMMIKNGTVINPATGINGRYDVGIADGKIAALVPGGQDGSTFTARETLDASGLLVTPGLIDIHVHVFQAGAQLGIDADTVGVRQGVTTVVDAGSAGVDNFAQFVSQIVERKETEVLAWLNIARQGLAEGLAELSDPGNLAPAETGALIRQNPLIRGIKVRMSSSVVGQSGIQPLLIAKEAAREAQVPLFVHVGNAPPALGDILDLLEEEDVVTHAFHGKPGGILDPQGELIPQAARALERGVRFDVGHGTASFSFQTMIKARRLKIAPYSISTDIYEKNFSGPVHSLTMTMSKFLALEFPLGQVIEAVTWAPARILGLQQRLGSLALGRAADISILRLEEETVVFVDAENDRLPGKQVFRALYTIKAGRVVRL